MIRKLLPAIALGAGLLLFACAGCQSAPTGKNQNRTNTVDPDGKKGEANNGKSAATENGKQNDPARGENGKTNPEGGGVEEHFVAGQPEFPVAEDDAFFKQEIEPEEFFRVLIDKGNYQVRQVGGQEYIRRKVDPNGDRDQLRDYLRFHRHYDFTDFVFKGLLSVRLNPHSGDIEFIKYVEGRAPGASQVTILFKNDLSRFAFSFPRHSVVRRNFTVRYEWRIQREPGLTDEVARQRLIEFLKSQKRE